MILILLVGLILAVAARYHRRRVAAIWQEELASQAQVMTAAEAAYANARLTREIAELAVTEYEQIFKNDLLIAELEVAQAEVELEHARRRDGTDRERSDPPRNPAPESEERRALVALEQARARKRVLQMVTRDKTVKELTSDAEKARSDELAKKALYDREKSALQALNTRGPN